MSLIVNIDTNITENAAVTACKINDRETRIRTYALNIAAQAAAMALTRRGIITLTKDSLFRISSFAQNFELADIYIDGFRFDVRITFDGQIFTVPKTHEKYDAVPYAYIVVKMDKTKKQVEILGFVDTKNIEYERTDSPYYVLKTDILTPIEKLREFINNLTLKTVPYSADIHEKIQELCACFVDEQISESEKVFFIKHVIACSACRETFCDFSEFDNTAAQVKNYNELLNDSTLSVLSGNKQELNDALVANLSLVENAQENTENNTEDDEQLIVDADSDELPELVDTEEVPEIQDNINLDTDIQDIETLDLPEEDNGPDILLEEDSDDVLPDLQDNDNLNLEDDSVENNELISDSQENQPQTVEDLSDTDGGLIEEQTSAENTGEEILEDELPQLSSDEMQDDNLLIDLQSENNDEILNESIQKDETDLTEDILLNAEPENLEIQDIDAISEDISVDEIQDDDKNPIPPLQEEETDVPLIENEPLEQNADDLLTQDIKIEDIPAIDTDNSEALENLVPDNELSELETSFVQEINPVDELPDENIQLQNDADNSDEQLISYQPQEPVELNYDDETTEEDIQSLHGVTNDTNTNQDEMNFDEQLDDNLHADDIHQEVSMENAAEDEEIQNLLDNDLMSILSEDDNNTQAGKQYDDEDTNTNQFITQPADEDSNQPPLENGFVETIEEGPDDRQDETISSLFDNNEESHPQDGEAPAFELAKEPVSAETVKKTKKLAVLAGLLVVMMAAGGTTLYLNHQKSIQNTADNSNQGDELFDFENKGEASEAPAIPQDINKSMTNSFSDKPAAITITKLSWQVSEKLAAEASVKEYLQTAGKNIQMNLQNDLANSADVAFNNIVKVSFVIAPDNTMKGMQVLESSGSDKIDDTILRSIKNTLKYVSVPKLKDYKSDYFLTLIINF